MLKQRVLSALVLGPLLAATVWFGGIWFTGLMILAALMAGRELYRLDVFPGSRPYAPAGLAFIHLFVLAPYFAFLARHFTSIILSLVVASAFSLLFMSSRAKAAVSWLWTWVGALYVGWMLSLWVALRGQEAGREWVFLGLGAVFAGDTAAYFVGRSLGRHRLAPTISPRKTWEGAIAGLLATILVAWGLGLLFQLSLGLSLALLLGVLVAIFGHGGDLLESWLKRRAGAKDSGNLIPGHGGVLDRLDSVVLVGAVMYYFVTWAMR